MMSLKHLYKYGLLLGSIVILCAYYNATHQNVVNNCYNFDTVDALMAQAVSRSLFPGGVVLINFRGETIYHKPFGKFTFEDSSPLVTTNTLYDISSVTKIIATTALSMILYDQKKLDPDAPVTRYLPGFVTEYDTLLCVKHLLGHDSGLCDIPFLQCASQQELFNALLHPAASKKPGEEYYYSFMNMMLMQLIIERLLGKTLDDAVREYITKPLGMHDTLFNPLKINTFYKERCAPTREKTAFRDRIQGRVQDEVAALCGGVAGTAGLFSTSSDLEKFATMIMHDGAFNDGMRDVQLIDKNTVREWTTRQNQFNRGYGWEIGRHISANAFGHFGWTGSSLWCDRDLQLFCIVLTNRTFPDGGDGEAMRGFREQLHECITSIVTH